MEAVTLLKYKIILGREKVPIKIGERALLAEKIELPHGIILQTKEINEKRYLILQAPGDKVKEIKVKTDTGEEISLEREKEKPLITFTIKLPPQYKPYEEVERTEEGATKIKVVFR